MQTRLLIALALVVASTSGYADTCVEIVEDTVAETRLGMGQEWNGGVESQVRAAAGSACAKALSGRYTVAAEERITEERLDQGVSAEPADDADDDKGLVIRPLAGTASKKPYERARQKSN